MRTFVANTQVTLTIPFVDTDGNPFVVDAVQFRVTDGDGNERVPLSDVVGFLPDAPEAVVTISADANAILDTNPRAIRVVELHCTSNGNIILLTETYIVEINKGLVVGQNTFQTLASAELVAFGMPNLTAWPAAPQQERVNALVEARQHIVRLNFSPLNGNRWWGQDSLNFVPEGTSTVNQISKGNLMVWGGDLSFLTPEQFVKLPKAFLDQLYLAQVAEAEAILGGDPIEERRRAGLTLDTIGPTKQMFRTSKPLDLPVCRRALGYLSRFIQFSRPLTRT